MRIMAELFGDTVAYLANAGDLLVTSSTRQRFKFLTHNPKF